MSSYNLMKVAGREALRQDRQAELDALVAGTWPRDLNDQMRWSPDYRHTAKEWAAKMCRAELAYLEGVTERLAANDPDLEGWER